MRSPEQVMLHYSRSGASMAQVVLKKAASKKPEIHDTVPRTACSMAQVLCIIVFAIICLYPSAARAQLGPGVTQSAAHTANVYGVVTKADGTPVAGASVKLEGSATQSTTSNGRGAFTFTAVPYGSYELQIGAPNLGVTSQRLVLSGDVNVAVQFSARTNMKTIASVSTTTAGAHINVTPASIASVNPTDYVFEGNSSWKQLLDTIPGVAVSGNLDGGASAAGIIPGSPIQPVTLSINGALPYETSVTIDGMPFNNSSSGSGASGGSGVDLSNVPMAAFDTADVVRGPGADAPSIVDSIGGSFVLHAPGRQTADHFEVSTSNDPFGGVFANAKLGLRIGRLSGTIVYGAYNSPGPLGNTTGQLAFAGGDILTINGQKFKGCSAPNPYCVGFPPVPANANYTNCYCFASSQLLVGNVPISTEWTQHTGAMGLSYDIGSSINAQVFYAGASAQMLMPPFEYQVAFSPGPGYSGGMSPGVHNLFNPVESTETALPSASHFLEEKVTAHIGSGVLRAAALQNYSYDQYGESTIGAPPNGQYTLNGTAYLASAPATPVNFNGGTESVTFFSYPESENVWVDSRDLLLSYASQIGNNSDLGISWVKSYYNDAITTAYTLYGSNTIELNPANSETTQEFRLHFGTQIADQLFLDASMYLTQGNYHIQGYVINGAGGPWQNFSFPYSAPRLGLVWHKSANIAVRAAAGGGYALPPLTDLLGGVNVTPTCSAGICNVSQANVSLKPEKSFGFDVGTDIRLQRYTTLSLDLYRTNLFGQFFDTTTAGSYSGPACSTPPCVLYTSQYNNMQQSRYQGLNFNIQGTPPSGVYWQASLGLTRAFIVSVPGGFYSDGTCPHTECTNLYVIPGINFNGESALAAVPYANGIAKLGYKWSGGSYLDLSPSYYGNGNAYFRRAFIELDAHGGITLEHNVSLLATFRNVTGVYGENYQVYTPSLGAPTVSGAPYPLFGLPYGPRALIVTLNYKY